MLEEEEFLQADVFYLLQMKDCFLMRIAMMKKVCQQLIFLGLSCEQQPSIILIMVILL